MSLSGHSLMGGEFNRAVFLLQAKPGLEVSHRGEGVDHADAACDIREERHDGAGRLLLL